MFGTVNRSLRILFMLLALTGCKVVLHSGLSEVEANKMMAVLLADGVSVKKELGKDGTTILVSREQFADAVNTINYHGLPSQKQATLQELFPSDSLVASPTQEWIRFNYARSQELSASISGLQGVIRADVHIAEEPPQGAFEDEQSPTVSVMVQIAREHLSEMLIPEIKNLVAFSIPDIKYEHVNVVLSPVDIAVETQDLVALWGLVLQRSSAQVLTQAIYSTGIALVVSLGIGIALWIYRRKKAATGSLGKATNESA